MSSTETSSSADQPNGHNEAVLGTSDNSSEFVDDSDTDSDESRLASRRKSSRSRLERREERTSPRLEATVGRPRKGKSSSSRKHYSDRYLELFRQTVAEFEDGGDGVPTVNLRPTQVGAVRWRRSEKERLFNALSRKGRLDERGIASMVGKSELEVRDYILFLREREAERHLFERQTERISHADVPAAVEISTECETALEQAADALATFQDQYDAAVAEQQHPGTWSIDWDTARVLDEQVLDREEAGSDSEDLSTPENVPAEGLFRLSTWLELSERIFMNPGPPQLHSNWHNIAPEEENPAMTHGAFSDFYELTVSVTRRMVQTCIFLAESRMRCTKSNPSVREQDVVAALGVLGMTCTLSDRLLRVARRNSLRVIRGSHDKGSRVSQFLTYDEVEEELSKRKRSNRGRRSVSTASRSSAGPTSGEDDVEDDSLHAATPNQLRASRDASPSLASNQTLESDISMSDVEVDAEDSDPDEYGSLSYHVLTSRQKRRRLHREVQQDAYMEDLDHLRSEEEERLLWRILGDDTPLTVQQAVRRDPGARPKTLRKTKEELADWQGVFAAEWEVFGELVPEQKFVDTDRPTKKARRVDEPDQELSHTNQ